MKASQTKICVIIAIFPTVPAWPVYPFGAALATGERTRLSDLGRLEPQAFHLFLALMGEALAGQASPDQSVTRQTADSLLQIRLEPMDRHSHARIETALGVFSGRDHWLTVTPTMEAA